MLQESGIASNTDFETLQAFLQSNLHGDTEPFTSSDDEDDIGLLLEQDIEQDGKVNVVSSKKGIERPHEFKKPTSPVNKTRTSAKSNSKASPKSSISSNSKKIKANNSLLSTGIFINYMMFWA